MAIECSGNGVALVLKTDAKTVRLSAGNPPHVQFIGKMPASVSIGCGPINRPVIVLFKPAPGGKSNVAGEAVSVEFQDK